MVGLGGTINYGKGLRPDFRLLDGDLSTFHLEHFSNIHGGIEVDTARTLVVRSVSDCRLEFTARAAGGDVFAEDFVTHGLALKKQNFWARQLNIENEGTHLSNDGGTVWVLGYKTERGGSVLQAREVGGARSWAGSATRRRRASLRRCSSTRIPASSPSSPRSATAAIRLPSSCASRGEARSGRCGRARETRCRMWEGEGEDLVVQRVGPGEESGMELRFLLGPAGSGKTHRCVAGVRAALKGGPTGLPLLFVAPKQATFQLERQVLADADVGGFTRLEILSFERLARHVLERAGRVESTVLGDEGRVMVLRALLGRMEGDLKYFGRSARAGGLARDVSGAPDLPGIRDGIGSASGIVGSIGAAGVVAMEAGRLVTGAGVSGMAEDVGTGRSVGAGVAGGGGVGGREGGSVV